MIIEKKSTIIDPSKVVIPYNYLLVKPDADYEELHHKGRNTGIAVTNFIYDGEGRRVSIAERNRAVTGTVYAVPDKLIYEVDRANKMGEGRVFAKEVNGFHHIVDPSTRNEINDLKLKSLEYDVDMEVSVGDRVKFSYMVHERAMTNKSIVETTEGDMYFIRYDDLFMVINEDLSPKKMVNGFILVEADEREEEETLGAKGTEKNGLFIVNLKDSENRERKSMTGTILSAATPCRGYKSVKGEKDPDTCHENGEKVMFDPRGAFKLDLMNHQHSEVPQYLIHRIDIWLTSKENPNFDEILIAN